MTTTPQRSPRAVPAPALDRAADALAARRTADVELLVAAVEWAEANPAGPGLEPSGWGDADLFGEGFLPLAGEGAPSVAEFAPVELGAVLGWTAAGAQVLIGDALEIKWRLPRLWSLVVAGRVPVHLAREVAQHTRPLAYDAARWADRLVTADPARLDRARIAALVREARLFHEPDLVVGEEEDDLASRRVDLFPGRTPATTDVVMKLDTRDADAFDRAVSQAAEALRVLGDGRPRHLSGRGLGRRSRHRLQRPAASLAGRLDRRRATGARPGPLRRLPDGTYRWNSPNARTFDVPPARHHPCPPHQS